jgi:septal ring factor EnvC (AmiA/AmiB activator)
VATLRRSRRLLATLLPAVLLVPAAPARAQTGQPSDVEDARRALEAQQREVARIREEARAAEAEHQARWAQLVATEDAIAATDARLAAVDDETARLRTVAEERAVAVYVGGRPSAVALLDEGEFLDRDRMRVYANVLAGDDRQTLDRLEVLHADEERARAELVTLRAAQQDQSAASEAAAAAVLDLLGQAETLEQSLEAEYQAELAEQRRLAEEARRREEERLRREAEERRRADEAARQEAEARRRREQAAATPAPGPAPAPPAASPGPAPAPAPSSPAPTAAGPWSACPVPGSVFVDSWGAPRAGGRRHEGADLMALRGTPNLAVVSGTVAFRNGPVSGLAVWLNGDDGHRYFYAHLEEIVGEPRRVAAGEVIGLTGNTGDAVTAPTHTHFQYHPGGGGAVNPYPVLRANGC